MPTPPLTRAERGAESPLSFAQQRLWFIDQLEPGSALYNNPLAVRLSGELKKEALRRTLTEIVRRHEVLRTSFRTVEGRAGAGHRRAGAGDVAGGRLGELEEAKREVAVRRLAQEEAAEPFDLGRGPLLRAAGCCGWAESEHVVLMTMHHIVSDGWSMGVLTGEVAALYRAYSEGQESPLPELEVQYADFARLAARVAAGRGARHAVALLAAGSLRGAATLELPTDRPRPAAPSYSGAAPLIPAAAGVTRAAA